MKAVAALLVFAFRLAKFTLVLGIPLLGLWLASSLISALGGPREAAMVGSALLFPILPLVWEARSARVFHRRVASRNWYGKPPRRWGSAFDRIVLRTLALNGLLIAALLAYFPKVAFSALATRGDWFLEGRSDATSQRVREAAFAAAGGLEWLHRWANPNPYRQKGDETPVPVNVKPIEEKRPQIARIDEPEPPRPTEAPTPIPRPDDPTPPPQETDSWKVGATSWPKPGTPHRLLASMGAEDEASIEAVADYFAKNEPDPFERVKGLHDWVVTRLRYDYESYLKREYPPQEAEAVFAARTGVCSGYANLMVALGKRSGDRIVYLTGDARQDNGEVSGLGHAWNAVEVGGEWYLLDATWDDPVADDGRAVYRTDYLFIPPSVAILDHFPEEARWQLLAEPLSRGDFLRQPFTGPGLAREGLTLVTPGRSAVEVADAVELALENPRRLHVSASLVPDGEKKGAACGVDNGARVRLRCAVPRPGKYKAQLFTNRARYGQYTWVAGIEVTRR